MGTFPEAAPNIYIYKQTFIPRNIQSFTLQKGEYINTDKKYTY
uniref:Uncharacterized protein n=1 Tax=Anguilla anguilla TaxID=7936 RepID=A0A0E9QQU8_ANGAN